MQHDFWWCFVSNSLNSVRIRVNAGRLVLPSVWLIPLRVRAGHWASAVVRPGGIDVDGGPGRRGFSCGGLQWARSPAVS